jgi:membrane-associated phospholipid phosphatase
MNKMNLMNILSASMWVLLIVPIVLFLYTRDTLHLQAFLGLWATGGLNDVLKSHIVGTSCSRPKGAKDCNFWADNGNQEGKPGMPSGHSSISTFFSAFYYQQTKNIWIKLGLILYAILVMISRYMKQCHSLLQILSGAALGLLMNAITGYAFSYK